MTETIGSILRKKGEAIWSIAPNATGAPITTEESGRIVVDAFVQAGVLSLLAVVILLWIALRNARDVALPRRRRRVTLSGGRCTAVWLDNNG